MMTIIQEPLSTLFGHNKGSTQVLDKLESIKNGPPESKDAHYLALRNFSVAITALNIFGYWLLGFEQPWLWPFLAVIVAYVAELLFETLISRAEYRQAKYKGKGFFGLYSFLLPAHITGLAVNMLVYANNQFWPIVFGIIAGVGSKYVFQATIMHKRRHFMNPSNFGITAILLFFGSWVAVAPPYQYGENVNSFFRVGIALLLATAGTVLNATLTKKIPLIVGWVGGFVIQAILRHYIFDVALNSALAVTTGIAFVLFTNYMISDPGSTPTKPLNQFMFGGTVATVYGILMVFNIVYTLFFALTIVCALRGILWWALNIWKQKSKNTSYF